MSENEHPQKTVELVSKTSKAGIDGTYKIVCTILPLGERTRIVDMFECISVCVRCVFVCDKGACLDG